MSEWLSVSGLMQCTVSAQDVEIAYNNYEWLKGLLKQEFNSKITHEQLRSSEGGMLHILPACVMHRRYDSDAVDGVELAPKLKVQGSDMGIYGDDPMPEYLLSFTFTGRFRDRGKKAADMYRKKFREILKYVYDDTDVELCAVDVRLSYDYFCSPERVVEVINWDDYYINNFKDETEDEQCQVTPN